VQLAVQTVRRCVDETRDQLATERAVAGGLRHRRRPTACARGVWSQGRAHRGGVVSQRKPPTRTRGRCDNDDDSNASGVDGDCNNEKRILWQLWSQSAAERKVLRWLWNATLNKPPQAPFGYLSMNNMQSLYKRVCALQMRLNALTLTFVINMSWIRLNNNVIRHFSTRAGGVPRSMFSAQHEAFRDTVKKFMINEIAPLDNKWRDQGFADKSAWRKGGEQGFLCTTMPPEYGGSGADRLYAMILIEEQARINNTSLGWSLHSEIVAPYLLNYGSEFLKKKYLPPMATGEMIGAIAMSEPVAGSYV
jgi:hypothetical protein